MDAFLNVVTITLLCAFSGFVLGLIIGRKQAHYGAGYNAGYAHGWEDAIDRVEENGAGYAQTAKG